MSDLPLNAKMPAATRPGSVSLTEDAAASLAGRKNRPVAFALTLLVVAMVGVTLASAPLYQQFVEASGYGGTVQRADAASIPDPIDREMSVRFDATISPRLPLRVETAAMVTDQIGNARTVIFRATNLSDRPIFATTGSNISPQPVGSYFKQTECFCFGSLSFPPGETVEMSVTYFVDPALDRDRDLDTLLELTLSYTFYPDTTERS
jgi:cytochrome c oxidase assembly protein subunit 11